MSFNQVNRRVFDSVCISLPFMNRVCIHGLANEYGAEVVKFAVFVNLRIVGAF